MKKIRFFTFEKSYDKKSFGKSLLFHGKPTEPFIKILLCSRGTVKLFCLPTGLFVINFPLLRGNVPLFSVAHSLTLVKESRKKFQKRSHSDASVRVQAPSLDPLSALWFEAMKPLRKSLRLGAELFACQNLWRVLDGFLFFVRLGQATELFGWVCRQNLSHPNSLF